MLNSDDCRGWEVNGKSQISTQWYVGLDLGQIADPSALAVVEKTIYHGTTQPIRYACRHLERFPLGTSYPAIVQAVEKLLTEPSASGQRSPLADAALVVDGTGVGRAVVDMFRNHDTIERAISIVITGGLSHTFDDDTGSWHVPKKELVSVLHVLMQTKRLTVARELPLAEVLIKELLTFKVKITIAGNETFEAWRERDHDDMVLALAVALWYAERDEVPDENPWEHVILGAPRRPTFA